MNRSNHSPVPGGARRKGTGPSRLAYAAACGVLAASVALAAAVKFETLDGWSTDGVPDNLETTRETYSAKLLKAISLSLPEQKKLTDTHPEFLSDDAERQLHFVEDCEVYVSFVHEGAGYKNVACFHTYDTTSPPTAAKDVTPVVVFPNASFKGSGGGLVAGDTVYVGKYKKGESMSFALAADGFSGGKVSEGKGLLFSLDDLNPEKSSTDRRHTVLLADEEDGRFVLAFEDIQRDSSSCDHDFNDLVLSVRVTPSTAVETKSIPVLDGLEDKDADGVVDAEDDYPDDASRAFRVEYPSATTDGTVAFEDMWPERGDDDFNDFVGAWHVVQARNAKSELVDVTLTMKAIASGASKAFGLRWRLPVARTDVSTSTLSVSGGKADTLLPDSAIADAVFEIEDDVYDAIPREKGFAFANTEAGSTLQKGETYELRVVFKNPLDPAKLGAAPYDVFLKDGNAEVHLPNQPATTRMHTGLWGTEDDASDPKKGVTFRTSKGHPWGISVNGPWTHPREHVPIGQAYPRFASWAESGGTKDTDWASRPDTKLLWKAK